MLRVSARYAGVALWLFFANSLIAQVPQDYLKRMLKPNPNSPRDLLELLRDPDIAREVGIESKAIDDVQSRMMALYSEIRPATSPQTPEERQAFSEKMKKLADTQNALITQAIEELLPPDKLSRLKQMAYRIEVQKMGFAKSLTEGWLADEVKTHDAQQATLARKISEIESQLQQQIQQLTAEAEAKILAELSPEQRERARNAMGEPFHHRSKSMEEILMLRTRERTQQLLNRQAPKE